MSLSDAVIGALQHGQVKGAIFLGSDLTELIGTAAMAGSLPVTIASDDTLITAIKTALELIDNAISGTEMQVDVLSLPAVPTRSQTTLAGTKASSGDNEVVAAPGSGYRLVVTKFVIQNESDTATTMILRSAATTNGWRILGHNQGDGLAMSFAPGHEWELNENEALNLNLSGANSCGVSVSYFTEAV